MQPKAEADAVADFLASASDDAACAWLCRTAGHRTKAEEQGLSEAVHRLAPCLIRPLVPLSLARVD